MLGLKYLVVITKREYSEQYLEFFHDKGVNMVVTRLCTGTASDSMLDLLGVEKTEKTMFSAVVPDDLVDGIKEGLVDRMDIEAAGNGIAVFIQVDGVGGATSLKNLVGDKEIEKKEKEDMSEEKKSVLIITIVDKGYNDQVMDAARAAGAGGGTVVRAKGTGAEIAKFFGVSISEEKEMVYIVASGDMRDGIMKAIMEKAGANTDAHGIVFSIPVDSVLGIRSLERA
ncbi:MAG: P-II family nitrogen regulator [Clostridia bacterium]|nr:P-II family nitrogen regulator [Clostridia bacterium]